MIDIDNIANQAKQRHANFITLLLKEARDCSLPSPYSMLLKRGMEYIESERAIAFQQSEEITKAVMKAVNDFYKSDVSCEYIPSVDTLIAVVATQASKDINDVLSHTIAVNAQKRLISSSNKRMSEAEVANLAEQRSPFISLFIDKAGKRWGGQTYIRTLWRKFAVDDLADATVTALLANKQTVAKVIASPGKPQNNLVFSLTQDYSMPTWDEVKKKYFHPNTLNRVAPVGAGNGFPV